MTRDHQAIVIKVVIEIGINDQVSDRDQASVDDTTSYAPIKANVIGQVY